MKRTACYCVLLAALPLAAQTTPDRGASPSDPGAVPNQPTRTDDHDRHDYGWLGLVGLAGLAGLMRRQNTHDARTLHTHDPRDLGTRPSDRV